MNQVKKLTPLSLLVKKIVGGGTPERNNEKYWNGGIPWATVKDFQDGKHEIFSTQETISSDGLRFSASNLIDPLIPILCTRMAVGRIAIANFHVAINQDVKALYPKNDIHPKYFLYALDSVRSSLEVISTGSTVNGIRLSDLLEIELFSPDYQEQEKIAEVLSTIDQAIAQTEAIIAKQQRIKTGLMQDLLTKGIDEAGNVRSEETHEFKDSAIGRIPIEWEVKPCVAVCKDILVGIVIRPAQYYRPSGIPILRSANVRENKINFSDLVYMSEKDNELLAKSRLYEGDLVTVRTGYPGTTAVVPSELNNSNCVDIVVSRPNLKLIRSHYLSLWINSDFGKKQVLEGQGGLAQQHFNVGEVRKLLVRVPSLEEQEKIENLLLFQDKRILEHQRQLQKLQRQKNGLMQDLLTGKVRVTDLLEAPP